MKKITGFLEEAVCLVLAAILVCVLTNHAPGLTAGWLQFNIDLTSFVGMFVPYSFHSTDAVTLLLPAAPWTLFYGQVYLFGIRLPILLIWLLDRARVTDWLLYMPKRA